MDDIQQKSTWLERVEDLIDILEGSSISELELTEQGTEIIIRRKPSMVMTAVSTQQAGMAGGAVPVTRIESSVAIVTPLTGVYYSAASPTSPPFVNIGDTVYVGQVVALIEAMKVFNEVTAEVSGRVVELPAKNGEVVQKGDALIRVETP